MTKLRYNRAPASMATLRRIVTKNQPMMMVWTHDAGSQADPVLVDVPNAKKLCAVHDHQDPEVQAEMGKLVAARQATFESLYRQLFNGLSGTEDNVVLKSPLSGEPMLIDVLMTHRDKQVPVERVATRQSGWSYVTDRAKALWKSTSQQIAALPW